MSKVLTGSKIKLRVGDSDIGWATGFQVQDEMRMDEIPQLDTIEIAEYAETGYRISFNISKVGLNDQTLINLGLSPNNIEDILLQPELTVLALDDTTNDPVYEILGVKKVRGSGTVNAKGIWSGSWSFVGRRGRDFN